MGTPIWSALREASYPPPGSGPLLVRIARRRPADPNVPMNGKELARARALSGFLEAKSGEGEVFGDHRPAEALTRLAPLDGARGQDLSHRLVETAANTLEEHRTPSFACRMAQSLRLLNLIAAATMVPHELRD